jgi:hypothetical protein
MVLEGDRRHLRQHLPQVGAAEHSPPTLLLHRPVEARPMPTAGQRAKFGVACGQIA